MISRSYRDDLIAIKCEFLWSHNCFLFGQQHDRSTGTMRNLSVNGLDGFNVDYLTFTLFRLRLEYSITLPVVRTSGVYNLNATLLDAIDLWGAGPFEFNAFSK